MSRSLLASAAILAACAAPARGATFGPAQAHYRATLSYDATRAVLVGTERIDFANTLSAPLRVVHLRIWANGRSCTRRAARVTIARGGRRAPGSIDCTHLPIELPRELAPGERATIILRVRIDVPRRRDRFGRAGGVVVLGNVLPVLAVDDGSGPRLNPYTAVGDPFVSLVARYTIRLTHPSDLTVLGTGRRVAHVASGGRTSETFVAARARDVGLVLGRYRVLRRRAGRVVVRYGALPTTPVAAARRRADRAATAVRRIAGWYGPYDARELDVAEVEVPFGGMEYPGFALVAPDVPEAIPHEIAHQWWYGIVGNDQWREPWLDESFATFTHRRIAGRLTDCDVAAPFTAYGDVRLDWSMDRWNRRADDYGAIYDGGACALEALRRGVRSERFDAILRTYVARHRHGFATAADFLAAVTEIAPDYDLAGWLDLARLTPASAAAP